MAFDWSTAEEVEAEVPASFDWASAQQVNPSPQAMFEEALAREEQETDYTPEEVSFLEGQEKGNPREGGGVRGIRNNNPGNIEFGEKWEGMSKEQSDERFIQFDSPELGIRAMARILNTYKSKHGIDTIEGIIGRWAPPSENDTESYVASVSRGTGISPTKKIGEKEKGRVIKAIIKHENGEVPYEDEVIERGIALAADVD